MKNHLAAHSDRILSSDQFSPAGEELLGNLYRRSERDFTELLATVPAYSRAVLALYCYSRAHLRSIGLSVAATCEEDDLIQAGGNLGASVFSQSRKPQVDISEPSHGRRPITLATQPLKTFPVDEDLEDSDDPDGPIG